MWFLRSELDPTSKAFTWKLDKHEERIFKTSYPGAELVISFNFPLNTSYPEAHRHIVEFISASSFRAEYPWLRVDETGLEIAEINLDKLLLFIRDHFSYRSEVFSESTFQKMGGTVRSGFWLEHFGHGHVDSPVMNYYWSLNMGIFYYHLDSFMLSPAAPQHLESYLQRFRKAYPSIGGRAFIMMQFGSTRHHDEITQAIRSCLNKYEITGLRADERQFHEDLFSNVLVYLYGCDLGISVFERLESDNFNPNVSLEVGYLMALRKPICLLKDQTLKTLQADLAGKLYRPFDTQDCQGSIDRVLTAWLRDFGFIP